MDSSHRALLTHPVSLRFCEHAILIMVVRSIRRSDRLRVNVCCDQLRYPMTEVQRAEVTCSRMKQYLNNLYLRIYSGSQPDWRDEREAKLNIFGWRQQENMNVIFWKYLSWEKKICCPDKIDKESLCSTWIDALIVWLAEMSRKGFLISFVQLVVGHNDFYVDTKLMMWIWLQLRFE